MYLSHPCDAQVGECSSNGTKATCTGVSEAVLPFLSPKMDWVSACVTTILSHYLALVPLRSVILLQTITILTYLSSYSSSVVSWVRSLVSFQSSLCHLRITQNITYVQLSEPTDLFKFWRKITDSEAGQGDQPATPHEELWWYQTHYVRHKVSLSGLYYIILPFLSIILQCNFFFKINNFAYEEDSQLFGHHSYNFLVRH